MHKTLGNESKGEEDDGQKKMIRVVCVCMRVCVCVNVCVLCLSNVGCLCVCVCVWCVRACKPVSQEKGKTVTFANDDMVLHYGGPHRHRRKSTPASLNRTPLHHNNPQYHQQQPSHHQHHQSLHHVLRSSPVSAHLRHWLAPGNSNMIETSKKSKFFPSNKCGPSSLLACPRCTK